MSVYIAVLALQITLLELQRTSFLIEVVRIFFFFFGGQEAKIEAHLVHANGRELFAGVASNFRPLCFEDDKSWLRYANRPPCFACVALCAVTSPEIVVTVAACALCRGKEVVRRLTMETGLKLEHEDK